VSLDPSAVSCLALASDDPQILLRAAEYLIGIAPVVPRPRPLSKKCRTTARQPLAGQFELFVMR
jgi:hypothetical protein